MNARRFVFLALLCAIPLLACAIPLPACSALPAGAEEESEDILATFEIRVERAGTDEVEQVKIVCKLFPKEAPLAVANFVGLAEGTKTFQDPKTGEMVKRRFYDGTIFYRVIPDFMIQGGDPLGTGEGNTGIRFDDEIVPELMFDVPGRLAMANSGPNTNGNQFFLTEVPLPHIDKLHTIFGQVLEGMEWVRKIARSPRDDGDKPLKPVTLERVTIQRVKRAQ